MDEETKLKITIDTSEIVAEVKALREQVHALHEAIVLMNNANARLQAHLHGFAVKGEWNDAPPPGSKASRVSE